MRGKIEFDITGQKFGKLLAIKRDLSIKNKAPFWLFECDCGNIKSIRKNDVRTGKVTNCGCIKQNQSTRLKNIIASMLGKRFNKFIITDFVCIKQGNSHWKCKCDCGNERILAIHSLKDNNTTSCGCARIYRNDPGESGLKRLYSNYKIEARHNNRVFNLTMEEFKEITSKNCTYCGAEPKIIMTLRFNKDSKQKEYASYKFNGIDRIDSNRGYEKGNVTPCCKWCNMAKRERTVDEFKKHVIEIYRHSIMPLSVAV